MAQRLIIKHRRNRYLFSHRPFTSAPATAGNSGTGGASLYVTSTTAGSTPPAINYRRFRLLRPGQHILALGNVVTGNKTSRADTVTSPTAQFSYSLSASTAYRFQVRTWKDDKENPVVAYERLFDTDGDSEPVEGIRGSGYLLTVMRCSGGGGRFDFVWNNVLENGVQPTEFALIRQSGPTSPSEVTTSFLAGVRHYQLEVTGLTDAGSYVFRIVARNGSTTQNLDNGPSSGDPDIAFTADGSGPSAVASATYSER